MPFKKISSFSTEPRCLHPEHNPPTMILMEPGVYEYTCPGCEHSQEYVVPPRPSMVDAGFPKVRK